MSLAPRTTDESTRSIAKAFHSEEERQEEQRVELLIQLFRAITVCPILHRSDDSSEDTMKADVSPKRPDRSVVAAAAELRRQDERERAAAAPPVEAQASQTKSSYEDYTRRKEFRRMVDLGILQTNPREVSLESLQVSFSCYLPSPSHPIIRCGG